MRSSSVNTSWLPLFLGLVALVLSTNATAAPTVIIGTDSISPGDSATINLVLQSDGTVSGLDFKVEFDNTEFSGTPSCVSGLPTDTGSAQAAVTCAAIGNQIYVFVNPPYEFPVPQIAAGSQSLGSITFQSQPTTPVASYDLTSQGEKYFDSASAALSGTPPTDGSIDVVIAVDYCNNVQVGGLVDSGPGPVIREACDNLTIGPDYTAEFDAGVIFSGGLTVEFLPGESGVRIEQGAIIDIDVCGQSLCEISDDPMPSGCHSCVEQICGKLETAYCCETGFNATCVEKVGTLCGLTCQ